ncbi:UDP-N-acetylmuramate dehydrogenase [Ravibacter arvi]|uniref:UDP-N-acetylmuramate dehydrogenase n=1 Tax=Ravibacter arvi TaxID=2051041 RepID=UPI0031EBDF24
MALSFFQNHSLQPYNTFGIEANADFFCRVTAGGQLAEALRFARESGLSPFVLGGGSNILLLGDLPYLVMKMELKGIQVIQEDADQVRLRVGAGVVWHDLVAFAVSQGWGGLENLSLIPGSVGAAPIQNIGAYGVEIKDVFYALEAVRVEDGQTRIFSRDECRFGYRDSIFKQEEKNKWVISSVDFNLSKAGIVHIDYGDVRKVLAEMGAGQPGIADVSRAIIQIRRSKLPDPAETGNAGSFFKNPEIPATVFETLKSKFPAVPGYPQAGDMVKVPAGWLIETAGWKGYREGRVGVHDRQALVLVNLGGAGGGEVKALASKIQASVEERFGIRLQPEVNYIGGGLS